MAWFLSSNSGHCFSETVMGSASSDTLNYPLKISNLISLCLDELTDSLDLETFTNPNTDFSRCVYPKTHNYTSYRVLDISSAGFQGYLKFKLHTPQLSASSLSSSRFSTPVTTSRTNHHLRPGKAHTPRVPPAHPLLPPVSRPTLTPHRPLTLLLASCDSLLTHPGAISSFRFPLPAT